jgi:hypothetical protein
VAFRKNLSVLKKFMEKLDFIHLNPDTAVAANTGSGKVYALSNRGKEYAFYLEKQQDSAIKLQLPAGKYILTWTDPISGVVEKPRKITHKSGVLSLPVPASGTDYALHIQAAR